MKNLCLSLCLEDAAWFEHDLDKLHKVWQYYLNFFLPPLKKAEINLILVEKNSDWKKRKKYLTWDKTGFLAVCFTLSCGKRSFSDPGHIAET